MSLAFVGITLNIRNNRTYPIRINVLGSPYNPLDTANATTEYRWDITAFTPSNDDVLTLEYKPVGAAVFSTFTYQIYNTNTEALISALDSLGIGYFQSYTELGQLYLSTYNDDYVFGLLTITNNGTPATSTTTTTTTGAPTSTTTTSTTSAPTTSTTSTTTAAPTTTTSTTTAAPTSTTTTSTTAAPTTTTSTTTAAPTSTTTSTTTTLSFIIGFGGAPEDACGFAASGTVTGDNPDFCSCTTFTGAIIAAAATGTWYVSFGGNVVSVSVINGNPVATVTSACTLCSSITSTTTTTTTAAPTTTTSTTTAAPTSTTTTTTTAAPTSTTTTTTTAAPTTTSTTTSTTSVAANIFIQNLSLDVSISQVNFGASTATLVAGTLPNTTGNGTDLYTTEVGTYTLDVYRSNTVAGQHITVTDSNLTVQCNFFSNGTGIESFTGVVYDGITPINIEALDGAC